MRPNPDPGDRPRSRFGSHDVLLAIAAMAVGLAVRLSPILAAPFPTGDGGLFLQMLDELRRTLPALPATTSYDRAGIPFVYPPLAFYVAAVIGNALPVSSLDLLRFFPLAFSVLGVGAVYELARRVLGSSLHAFVAAMAFAILPRSYDWVIAGGGLTRAPGLLFALLTLIAWLWAFDGRGVGRWAIAGLGLGATALTHPQAAIFAAVGMMVLLAFRGRRAWSPLGLVAAAGAALLAVSPWLVALLAIHGPGGIGDLLAASDRWNPLDGLFFLTDFTVTGVLYFTGPVMLGFAGLVACLLRGQYMLPVWAASVFVAGAGGGNFLVMPLVAMLIATFLLDVALGLDSGSVPRAVRARAAVVFPALLAIALVSGASATSSEASLLQQLSPEQRSAMAWVAANTKDDAAFLVVEPLTWGVLSEWFPTLTHRVSINTLQGTEWLGRAVLERRLSISRQLSECAGIGVSCLTDLASDPGLRDAFLFIPKGLLAPGIEGDCCLALREGLRQSTSYTVVYDGPGASIFAPRSSAVSP